MKKTAHMESSAPPCQVDDLLLALRQIQRHTKGYHGVHLRFSQLDRAHRQPFHRRAIATAFNKLIHNKNGQLFWTREFDVVFICQSSSTAQIDSAVINALRAVEDSPVIKELVARGRDDELCDRYQLENDLKDFMTMAENLKNTEQSNESSGPSLDTLINGLNQRLSAPEEKSKKSAPESKPQTSQESAYPIFTPPVRRDLPKPMGPQQLDQLERNLINMDIYPMLSDQTAFVVAGDAAPQPIFTEYFISVEKITTMLLPGYDIKDDKWLFQRLTRTFDTKLFQILPKKNLLPDQVVSLNINVDTILGPDFDPFIRAFKKQNSQPIILEMRLFDVISDIEKYYEAREKITELGCRISLDAVGLKSLAVLDRALLDVDFLKMSWLTNNLKNMAGEELNESIRIIDELGKMRIILCHCDTQAALEFGKSLGIHMYQGFHIDKIVGG